MEIGKTKAVSELEREYLVASSTNGKTAYLVPIPSCSCPDFEKNGSYAFCKHIIFLLVHVLGNAQSNKHLESQHLPRQVLTNLLTATISESSKHKMRRRKLNRKVFQKILEESPYYQDKQTLELQLKGRGRAKCSSTKCDKDLKSGFLCFCVSGAISVPYQAVLSCKSFIFVP